MTRSSSASSQFVTASTFSIPQTHARHEHNNTWPPKRRNVFAYSCQLAYRFASSAGSWLASVTHSGRVRALGKLSSACHTRGGEPMWSGPPCQSDNCYASTSCYSCLPKQGPQFQGRVFSENKTGDRQKPRQRGIGEQNW